MRIIKLILVFLVLTKSSISQEIVLPYEFKSSSRVSFSDNGEIIAVLENNAGLNTICIIESQSGHLLAKQVLPADYLDIIQFKPSFNGNYIALIGHKEDGTYMFFYEYAGVNDIIYYNSYYVIEESIDDYNNIEIESTVDNSFYVKFRLSPGETMKRKYQSINKYSPVEGYFGVAFSIGNVAGFEKDISENEMDFRSIGFSAYDISLDNKYVTVLSDINIPKRLLSKELIREEHYSFGILDWQLSKAKRNYLHLFNSDCAYEEKMDDNGEILIDKNKIEYHLFGTDAVYGLKYDSKLNRVYGIAETEAIKPLLLEEINELQKSNFVKKIEKNSAINYQTPFWKQANFNSALPFYYDIDSSKFHLIGNICPGIPYLSNIDASLDTLDDFNLYTKLIGKSSYLGVPYAHYFSPHNPFLFVVSRFLDNKYKIIRINLESNEIDYLDFSNNYSLAEFDFTTDDKLIVYEGNLKSSYDFTYSIFDLDNMIISHEGKLDAQKPSTIAKDVYFAKDQDQKHLLILTDSKVIDFNITAFPIHSIYTLLDSSNWPNTNFLEFNNSVAELCEEPTDKMKLNNPFSFFPNAHQIIYKNIDSSDFAKNGYSPDYNFTHDAMPYAESVYDYNYDYPEEINIFNSGLDVQRRGYDNMCSNISQFSWHASSNKLFAVTGNVVEKWNDQTLKSEFVYKNHSVPIHAFDVFFGDSLMVTSSTDGKICLWNVFSNSLVAELFLYNNGIDWVFILPDNYYYGTKAAVKKIAFAHKLKALPIEYFELKYDRPDLVLSALGLKNNKIILAFKKAYLKRLEKLNLTEDMLQVNFDVPYLKIVNTKLIPSVIESDSILLDLNMYDERHEIEKINIYINGVSIQESKYLMVQAKGFINKKVNLNLANGLNSIEVSVSNINGIESVRQHLNVSSTFFKTKDLYIVSIGAGKYSQNNFNLNYAAKDAIDFTTLLNGGNGLYERVHQLTFTDDLVTKAIINQIKDTLKKSKLNDVIYVYYAGHGILDTKLDYYLGTYDIDFANPSKNGIAYDELESILGDVQALQKTILLDACHSGEIEKDEVVENKNELIVENVTFRNVGNGIKNKSNLSSTEILKNVFSEMRKGTGATVISSAGGAEYAMESDEWKNGLFTYCLLHGLKDWEADLNKDGKIMLSELQIYLNIEVKKLSKGKQQPTSRIENTSMDFQIW